MTAHTVEALAGCGTAGTDRGDHGDHGGGAALWYEALGILPPAPAPPASAARPVGGPDDGQRPAPPEHPAPADRPGPSRPENDPVTWASRDGLLVNIIEHTRSSLRGRRPA